LSYAPVNLTPGNESESLTSFAASCRLRVTRPTGAIRHIGWPQDS